MHVAHTSTQPTPSYNNGGVRLQRSASVRHVEKGVVSIALDGQEFFIPMCRALVHDETHQVVGRIALGAELLDAFNDLPTTMEDVPQPPLVISGVGVTDAKGSVAEEGQGKGSEDPEAAAARMAQEADEARASVKCVTQCCPSVTQTWRVVVARVDVWRSWGMWGVCHVW